jgi:outer membrane immunogenic protein
MKRFWPGAGALIAMGMVSPASAADLAARPYTKAPAPMITPAYDWSGFYIGANGGWGSSHNCWTNTSVLGVPTVPTASEGCHDSKGGTAGGQIGYRWQAAGWVFGLEAQGNWADFSGSNVSLITLGTTNRTRIDAFGLFTGQIGYAWNNALFYVKGGAAVTDNRYNGYAAGTLIDTTNDTRWGGTVGAGLEFGFAPGWSAAVEYDHLFMGTDHRAFGSLAFPSINTRNDDIRQNADIVTVRVNYRFGAPGIAKY